MNASSSSANKSIVRDFIEEVFNRKNTLALSNYVASDHVLYGFSDVPLKGLEVASRIIEAFLVAFPDMVVTIEDMISEEDRVALRYIWKGSQRGDFAINPPKIVVPPPPQQFQKLIKVTGTNIYRIELATKKISETHVQMDFLALYRLLGMLEPLDERIVKRSLARAGYVIE